MASAPEPSGAVGAVAPPDLDSLTESQTQRRQRVIEAAMDLASSGGYEAVQMRDVAARADVALGTIYRYFTSKDHLLTAAWAEWASRLVQRLVTRPAQGQSIADQVADVMRRGTRAFERDPQLGGALITSLMSASADGRRPRTGHEMDGTLQRMLEVQVAGFDPELRRGILLVLGRVWLASLISWSTGGTTLDQVQADLTLTAHLLLDHR